MLIYGVGSRRLGKPTWMGDPGCVEGVWMGWGGCLVPWVSQVFVHSLFLHHGQLC